MLDNIWGVIFNILNILWGWPLFILVIGIGLYFGFRTHFFQITGIKIWWEKTIGEIFSKNKKENKNEGQLTPVQSFATVLGGTVGSGNIAGVATAIYSGGPGAIFWMWLISIFSMLVKMAEVTLAVFYHKKDENGEYYGGPMYYMKSALGKFGKILAGIYGVAFLFDVTINACVIQVSTLASSIEEVFNINFLFIYVRQKTHRSLVDGMNAI